MKLSLYEQLPKDDETSFHPQINVEDEAIKDTKNLFNNVESSIYLPGNRKQHLRHLMAAKLEMDCENNEYVHDNIKNLKKLPSLCQKMKKKKQIELKIFRKVEPLFFVRNSCEFLIKAFLSVN